MIDLDIIIVDLRAFLFKQKKFLLGDIMSFGYIKLKREALELLENDQDAFLLLSHIALRALRKDSKYNKHKLQPGQALIGDFSTIGLTQQRYRDTKERVQNTYKFATFKGTNKGTIATLLTSEIYDINLDGEERSEEQDKNEQRTNKERLTKNINKERSKEQQHTGGLHVAFCETMLGLGIHQTQIDSFSSFIIRNKITKDRIILGLEYIAVPGFKPNKDLISTLIWHCKETIPPSKDSIKISAREYIINKYQDGNTYFGMLCSIDKECITFSKGVASRIFPFDRKGVLDELLEFEKKGNEQQKRKA